MTKHCTRVAKSGVFTTDSLWSRARDFIRYATETGMNTERQPWPWSVFALVGCLLVSLQFVWANGAPKSPYTPGYGYLQLSGWPVVASLRWHIADPAGRLVVESTYQSILGHSLNAVVAFFVTVCCTYAFSRLRVGKCFRFSIRHLLFTSAGVAIGILFVMNNFSLMQVFQVQLQSPSPKIDYTNAGRPLVQRAASLALLSMSILGVLEFVWSVGIRLAQRKRRVKAVDCAVSSAG